MVWRSKAAPRFAVHRNGRRRCGGSLKKYRCAARGGPSPEALRGASRRGSASLRVIESAAKPRALMLHCALGASEARGLCALGASEARGLCCWALCMYQGALLAFALAFCICIGARFLCITCPYRGGGGRVLMFHGVAKIWHRYAIF